MSDVLRDPMWQFIGAIVTIVTIVVSIILSLSLRHRKSLSYQISGTPLLSVDEEVKGKIQVFFDKKPIQQVYLIVIKVMNSGNEPIRTTDYETPISFSLNKETEILSAEITEKDPIDIQASIDIEGNKVLISPALLNTEDSLTLKLLATKFNKEIIVGGRISGVKEITEKTEKKVPLMIKLIFIGAAVQISGLIGFLNVPTVITYLWFLFFATYIAGSVIGLTGGILWIIQAARARLKRKQLSAQKI